MHLTLLAVFGFFLHNNFPTESRQVSPDGVVYDGFKADAFRRITTHLIETNLVNKLGLCALKCLKKVECVSFNFGNPVNGKHVCELLRTDKYNSRSSFVTSTDYHYFYPGNKCMDPSPCQHNGSCYPDYPNNDYNCVCNGTKGKKCEIYYSQDCSEVRSAGHTSDGIYKIDPGRHRQPFLVFCDMTSDGGGWSVFQRRFAQSTAFYRGWQDYKTGFGNLSDEFWLGLDKIHRLTKSRITTLRIDLEDASGNTGYAMYSSFAIADESDSYRLSVNGYSGTAGDSINFSPWISNGMKFSTFDKDNDAAGSANCAFISKGGWWYRWCSISDLNGDCIWESFSAESLKKSQIKLKQDP